MSATTPAADRRFPELDTPALLLDQDALERNVARMRDLAKETGIAVRPHAKTHKSPIVARQQLAAGAVGICCAKLAEAQVMVEAGIPDVLVTTPVVTPARIDRLVALCRTARVAVVADDADNIAALAHRAATAGVQLDVLVEVDVGQGRCGIPPGDAAVRLVADIARERSLRFAGLQGYHGAIQGMISATERKAQVRDALAKLLDTAEHVRKHGIAVPTLTGGGTGTLLFDIELEGLTELQPGSYVVMDASYARVERDVTGTRLPFENALSVLTSVVSRPSAERAIVDVGWKSASVDSGLPTVRHRPDLRFEFAGDEHGKITAVSGPLALRPGDRLELIPGHCDTTINLYDSYTVTSGDQVTAHWPIATRGRSQ